MCIAIVKNKNIELPSENILRICFRNNPDGAGFVLNRNGVNYIYKGYFTFEGFFKALKSVSPLKEESLMIHFRVATHGKINIENCHPFPIENSFKNMLNPIYSTESDVLVHNGKLSIDITNSIYSDSMHFAKALFDFDRMENSDFLEYIIAPTEKNKRGNRVGIIKSNGETEHYGVGWIENNGILYSNDSFKENGTYKSSLKTIKKLADNKKISFFNGVFENIINNFDICDKCHCYTEHGTECNITSVSSGEVKHKLLCSKCFNNMKNLKQCNICKRYFSKDLILKEDNLECCYICMNKHAKKIKQ